MRIEAHPACLIEGNGREKREKSVRLQEVVGSIHKIFVCALIFMAVKYIIGYENKSSFFYCCCFVLFCFSLSSFLSFSIDLELFRIPL